MKYLWTTIHVENMEESVNFYQEMVGLSIVRRFPAGPKMEFAFLADGETQIELICEDGVPLDKRERGLSLGFGTEDLEATMQKAKARGLFCTEIYSPNPETRFFFVDDPNGVSVQFVEVK